MPNEYRCTRNQPYSNPRCFGHTSLEARQGYYIKAESEPEAKALMTEQFPDEAEAGFTAHLWKIDCPVCRGAGHQIPYTMMLDGSVRTGNPIICDLCHGAERVEVARVQMYYDRIA